MRKFYLFPVPFVVLLLFVHTRVKEASAATAKPIVKLVIKHSPAVGAYVDTELLIRFQVTLRVASGKAIRAGALLRI